MTKTKKLLLIFSIFLMFTAVLLIPSSVACAYAEEEGVEVVEEYPTEERDWGEWFKNELAPAITLVVSGALTIYLAISPILYKIKKASDKFKSATDDVNKTANEGNENTQKIEAFIGSAGTQFANFTTDIVGAVKALDERISRIEQATQNTERITRIGFGNTEELVKKGYAAEIEKVGKDNEQREETTESQN